VRVGCESPAVFCFNVDCVLSVLVSRSSILSTMGSGQRRKLEDLIPPNSLYGWAKRRHVAGGKHHEVVQLIAGLQAASVVEACSPDDTF
jgi:hypothetical protein